MAKLIDLTGQRFDKLIVIEKAPSRAKHTYWRCKCDCGNECEVSSEFLKKTNLPRDCGCSKKKNILLKEKEKRLNHLVGQRFGKLMVIESTNKRINGSIVWKCKCDCGNYKEIPTHALTSGHTQSCGCLIREVHGKDLTNQKFGKLTALYPCDYKKKSTILWHCKCDCGNECDVESYNLRAGLTQSCGCLASQGELKISILFNNKNIKFETQKSFSNCKYSKNDIKLPRFDFYVNNEYLIEYDGQQHFYPVERFGGDKQFIIQQQRDEYKNQWCKDNNIPLIRIPYTKLDTLCIEDLMLETTQFRVV